MKKCLTILLLYAACMTTASATGPAKADDERLCNALPSQCDSLSLNQLAEEVIGRYFEPTSPQADDELFLCLSEQLLTDCRLANSTRLRLEDARQAAMLNRVGHRASELELTLRDGSATRLSEVVGRHPLTLLVFYDPDCLDCAELEDYLEESKFDRVGVVMVCANADESENYDSHAAALPQEWTVGRYADDLDLEELYSVRMTPTVLLLDSTMTVLSKNLRKATIPSAIAAFE